MTPPSFKVSSRKQFQFLVFSFRYSVSMAQFPASFSGDTVHRFHPFQSPSNLGTFILLNLLCFTQIGAQIRRGDRFKIRALSLSTGTPADTFSVSSVQPSVNHASILHLVCFLFSIKSNSAAHWHHPCSLIRTA
jgi:hypothetical protein